jgi:FMN reductase
MCEGEGATTTVFAGAELVALPFYAPESPERTESARWLIDEIRRADALIIASSSYHGGISGLVKNAIDYTEDLREDDSAYLSGMPVGCIATGAGWQGVVATLVSLRSVVHALRGWPTPLGAGINTTETAFDPSGECSDEKARMQLTIVGQEVMQFARWRVASLAATGG